MNGTGPHRYTIGVGVQRDGVHVDETGEASGRRRLLVPDEVSEGKQPAAVGVHVGAQRVPVQAAVGVHGRDVAGRLGARHVVQDGGHRGDADARADQHQRRVAGAQGEFAVRLAQSQPVADAHMVVQEAGDDAVRGPAVAAYPAYGDPQRVGGGRL